MNYQFAYLALVIIFLAFWLVLYLVRPDARREMLTMSGLFGVAGVLAQPIYLRDWWRPLTITGTAVGVEDFLFGFACGGVAAVLYEELFRRRLRRERVVPISSLDVAPFWLLPIILFLMVYLVGINSFLATIFGVGVPLVLMLVRRPDLTIDAFGSGMLLLVVAALANSLVSLLFPGWIEAFYLFQNVPPVIVANVSIDDVAWYLLIGMYIGPLYEYWQHRRLVHVPT